MGHGQVEKARDLLLEAVTNLEVVSGKDHPATMYIKNLYVNSLSRLNLLEDAIQMRQQIFESNERVMGPEHPDTLMSLHNLASTYTIAKQPAKAVPIFEDCIAKSRITFGDESPNTNVPKYNLANSLLELGQTERAKNLYEEVYPVYRNSMGPLHWRTTKCAVALANVNSALGNWSEAAEWWERLATDFASDNKKDLSKSKSASGMAGVCQIYAGEVDAGLAKIDDFLEFVPTSRMPEKGKQSSTTRVIARAVAGLISQNRFETATPYAEQFSQRVLSPESHPRQNDELLSQVFLATIYSHLDREQEAAELISHVVSKDSEYSLGKVEDADEKKWLRDSLNKFLDAATRDGSTLDVFEPGVRRFLEEAPEEDDESR